MEITKQLLPDVLLLRLSGRLDATWSGHVQAAISSGIRSGAHRIHLDMEEVSYLSSAGISALLNAYKELAAIQGELAIPRYSEAVRTVLDLSGLGNLLTGGSILPGQSGPSASAPRRESANAVWEDFSLGDFPPQKCRLWGDPAALPGTAYTAGQCPRVEFPVGSMGLGLGAFGSDFADCAGRFGEALAIGGAGVSQPTDGSQDPDYIMSEGALIPAFTLLHGTSCHGSFSRLLRFEPKLEGGRAGLEELAGEAVAAAGGGLAAVAIIAEAASLVGAVLRKPPVGGVTGSIFDFPGVRDWFSFTAERAFPGSTVVIAGVAGRKIPGPLAPHVRPLGGTLQGHFHAAAFSYRPLSKGQIDLNETVASLFHNQHVQGLLHLLADRREAHGAGESEFYRGACWTAPLEVTP